MARRRWRRKSESFQARYRRNLPQPHVNFQDDEINDLIRQLGINVDVAMLIGMDSDSDATDSVNEAAYAITDTDCSSDQTWGENSDEGSDLSDSENSANEEESDEESETEVSSDNEEEEGEEESYDEDEDSDDEEESYEGETDENEEESDDDEEAFEEGESEDTEDETGDEEPPKNLKLSNAKKAFVDEELRDEDESEELKIKLDLKPEVIELSASQELIMNSIKGHLENSESNGGTSTEINEKVFDKQQETNRCEHDELETRYSNAREIVDFEEGEENEIIIEISKQSEVITVSEPEDDKIDLTVHSEIIEGVATKKLNVDNLLLEDNNIEKSLKSHAKCESFNHTNDHKENAEKALLKIKNEEMGTNACLITDYDISTDKVRIVQKSKNSLKTEKLVEELDIEQKINLSVIIPEKCSEENDNKHSTNVDDDDNDVAKSLLTSDNSCSKEHSGGKPPIVQETENSNLKPFSNATSNSETNADLLGDGSVNISVLAEKSPVKSQISSGESKIVHTNCSRIDGEKSSLIDTNLTNNSLSKQTQLFDILQFSIAQLELKDRQNKKRDRYMETNRCKNFTDKVNCNNNDEENRCDDSDSNSLRMSDTNKLLVLEDIFLLKTPTS